MFTIASLAVSTFFKSNWKILAIVGAIGLFSVVWFGVVYSFSKSFNAQQLAAISQASEKAGRAEAGIDSLKLSNEKFQEEFQRINRRLDETEIVLDKIRVESKKNKTVIYNYPSKEIGKTNSKEVEKWANDTNNGIFKKIEEESKK